MANSEHVIHLEVDTKEVSTATEDLERELLVLRLAFGKLKATVKDAMAPIGAVFIPVVQKAVWTAIRLTKSVGKVIAALFGYGAAANSAAKAQKKLSSANAEVKRSLMGFDEINRLQGGNGGVELDISAQAGELSPKLQAVVDKILSIVAPLKTIDISPAVAAFGRLKDAIAPISQALFAGLEWAWHNLLVPLAAWTIEDFLPVFLDTLSACLGVLHQVIVALQPLANWLWEKFLKPLGQWTGDRILDTLGWLSERLGNLSQWIAENQGLTQKIAGVVSVIALLNGTLGKSITSMNLLPNSVSQVSGGVKLLGAALILLIANWDSVKNAAVTVWESIKSVWGGAWSWFHTKVVTPLTNGFRSMANGIIGFFNGILRGISTAVNGLVGAVNKLSFTVPNWIPEVGGKSVGFNLRPVNTPQIPYLAQGAVLPANRPFLAVVGDQRHGTNMEAPLGVIQQAVAAVMGDQTAAILAGFEASVGVQREILQAVLGIHIGDDLIGQAVSRYQRKMAVVNGGAL